jgi:endo-1,4-beta-xylanase
MIIKLCRILAAFAAFAAFVALAHADQPALKDLVPKGMLIGAAINRAQSDGTDAAAQAIVTQQFNTISPENLLKWESVHPDPDRYDFAAADRYVAYGEAHGMAVIGHNLVWHNQTPTWVWDKTDRKTLLSRMRDHIKQVVGRCRGRIHGWDVVNEALDEDGSLRKSPWHDIIGDDYVAKAFEYAHDADPQAELYYNDYNLWKPAKRAGALRLVKDLKQRGLRIDAVGEQGHWQLATPTIDQIDATITELSSAGVKVMITELDVDVLPRDPKYQGADLSQREEIKTATDIYRDGLPAAQQLQLAQRYSDIFAEMVTRRDMITRVTFWGVNDAHSWLNDFPVHGRTNHPLLWDRQNQPKPAFDAVVKVLQKS